MDQSIADPDIKAIITDMRSKISEVVAECCETFFGKPSDPREEWRFTDRLMSDVDLDHMITLGVANENFGALLAIAMPDPTIKYLVNETANIDDAVDALGEFTNNLSGVIMDIDEFAKCFGYLKPSLPLYSTGRSWFPRAWCIEGKLCWKEHWMYAGIAVRRATK